MPQAFSTTLIRFEWILEYFSCHMIHLTWINMNCRIHLNSETNHASQSFYSSVMLHATVKPEDQCPVQRLDYDRTNLLKNYPPEAEFVIIKVFPKNSIADEKLSKRFIRNVFVSVPDHSNLKWFQPWHEFYLGLFQVSFAFYSQFIILFLLWSRVSHNSVKCEIKKQNFWPSQSYLCQVGNVLK